MIRSVDGLRLASGEWEQVERAGVVTSDLTFRFRFSDGSVHRERVEFSHSEVMKGVALTFVRLAGPLYFMGPVWRVEPN